MAEPWNSTGLPFRWRLIANSIWNVLLLIITFMVFLPSLPTGITLRNLSANTQYIAIIASGLALILASGRLDLSIGSLAIFCSFITALVATQSGFAVGVVAALVIALVVGLVHALLIGGARLNSAVVTFATGMLLARLAIVLSGSGYQILDIGGATETLVTTAGWVITLLALLAALYVVNFTRLVGDHAPGQSPEPFQRRRLRVGLPFLISALLAGLAGIIQAVRTRTGLASGSEFYTLIFLLAVFLGGTSFRSGIANPFGALISSAFIYAVTLTMMTSREDAAALPFVLALVLVVAILVVHAYHWLFRWIASRQSPPAHPDPA